MTQPVVAIVGVGKTGLAQAQAALFGRQGFQIALLSRDENILKQTADDLQHQQINATIFPVDLTKAATIDEAFDQVKQLGQLTAVIFNATFRPGIKPRALTAETAETGMLIGAVAPVAVAHAVIPALLESSQPTALLFTNSIAATKPSTGAPLQSMEKAAMKNFVLALNQDLAKTNIFAGQVTINTYIRDGHRENQDPVNIAKAYYKLFTEREPVDLAYHDLIKEDY
ncbi:SDR family oxidoreductase [Furfurilactobacillus milii]|uniref:SDR family NAD(P)-dependent oxidoreductase n=1 Tax=Furfurilactobacillus milii TaxID=2888272 RepID=A0A6N9I2L8_9LACO|nr:SDR family NAD(P)-dependent oxidoreductase [Furfurilactobacillus milii]MYV16974.1 SDR family NAD(P)-dependent oxidoreductase [Furfurilactobacillus milii]